MTAATNRCAEALEDFKDAQIQIFSPMPRQSNHQILDVLDWVDNEYQDTINAAHADVLRLELKVRSRMEGRGGVITDDEVRELWARRQTWAALMSEVAAVYYPHAEPTEKARFPYAIDLTYDIGWGLRQKVSTVTDLVASMALACANEGDFARAADILQTYGKDKNHPAIATAWALLYFKSRRWPDVISTVGQHLTAPPLLGFDDLPLDPAKPEQTNNVLVFLGSLLTAYAHAHLDNAVGALAIIEPMAENPEMPNVSGLYAGAFYLNGMIARRQGDEDRAQAQFAAGLSLHPLPEMSRAQADSSIGLSVTRQDLIDRRRDEWDASTEPLLDHVIASENADAKAVLLAEAQEELDRQIGMDEIKQQVADIIDEVKLAAEFKRRGLKNEGRSNHLILSGPPGTGKTTIAEVIGKIYCGFGLLRTENIKVVVRKDLVAEYEGQTAIKAGKVIEEAVGGVLFIDEAYTLIQQRKGQPDPFGQEVVELLLTETVKHRDDTLFILAGYEKELQAFLDVNQGMESRFPKWVRFRSYRPEELAQIAQVLARKRGAIMDDDGVAAIEEAIRANMTNIVNDNQLTSIDKAGNGRFMQNVVEAAERLRAKRLAKTDMTQLSDEDLMRLLPEDLVPPTVDLIRRHT